MRSKKTKCSRCPNLDKSKKTKNSIGFCRKYSRAVIDSLCWCEEQDGKIILYNF